MGGEGRVMCGLELTYKLLALLPMVLLSFHSTNILPCVRFSYCFVFGILTFLLNLQLRF